MWSLSAKILSRLIVAMTEKATKHLFVCLFVLPPVQLFVSERGGGQQQSGGRAAAGPQDGTSPADVHRLLPAGETHFCVTSV